MIAPIEKIIRDCAGCVQDFTKDGKCACCGECCGDFLPVSDAEILRIKQYVRRHRIKEQVNHVVDIPINFKCPFRDDARQICTIYEVRPEICRSFMCNYDRSKIKANKALFHQKYNIISMRGTFFGNVISQVYIAYLMGALPMCSGGEKC